MPRPEDLFSGNYLRGTSTLDQLEIVAQEPGSNLISMLQAVPRPPPSDFFFINFLEKADEVVLRARSRFYESYLRGTSTLDQLEIVPQEPGSDLISMLQKVPRPPPSENFL
jgi:hypothetical protein